MNTVGKIFIVLIFIMSLLVLGFSTSVYMAHKNWKTEAEKQSQQLKDEKAKTALLQDRLDTMIAERELENQIKSATLQELMTKVKLKDDELIALNDEIKQLQSELDDAVAVLDASQKTLESNRTEVVQLRTDLLAAQKERDSTLDEVIDLTQQVNTLNDEFSALKSREALLAQKYQDALTVLTKLGGKDAPELYADVPYPVEGKIVAVRSNGLLEISIGEDDGVMPGHQLQAFRLADGQSMYLGRVEVTQVAPDKAVCKVLPDYRTGTIMRGDDVSSKIK